MKVLLDTCISVQLVEKLKADGHNVQWIGDWPKDPGDEEILQLAFQEKRALITLDKDFGELAIVWDVPHRGIVRLVNLTIQQQATACLDILKRYERELQEGAIVTVEPGKIRIRSTS